MVDFGTQNQDYLDWHLAERLIHEFLPASNFHEEVLRIERGDAGQTEIRPADGHRRYWFHRCRVQVKRLRDGEERNRVYSFVFDWCEGRWQLRDVPAVCV